MAVRPELPPDRGYYFNMHSCDIKVIRNTLEDNGFRDIKVQTQNYDNSWSIFWSIGPIKKAVYENLR